MILLNQYRQAKGQIVEKDITFKMVDIEYFTNEALDSVTKSVRRSASDTCRSDTRQREILRDAMLEPIIIIINSDDSDTIIIITIIDE